MYNDGMSNVGIQRRQQNVPLPRLVFRYLQVAFTTLWSNYTNCGKCTKLCNAYM